MTEEQENKGPASAQPGPSASGTQAAQAASAPGAGARASQAGGAKTGPESGANVLSGDWRGPVFWMFCGVLLAALVGGAVTLAQRVSDERDLLAVAATLPASRPAPTAPSAAEQSPPGTAAAGRSTQQPRAQAASQPGNASILSGATNVPDAQPSAAAPKEVKAKARHTSSRVKSPASKRKPKSAARHQASSGERYADVFKRCPPPGVAGAVECRRHICNGAESEGPACRPYRGRLR